MAENPPPPFLVISYYREVPGAPRKMPVYSECFTWDEVLASVAEGLSEADCLHISVERAEYAYRDI